MAQAGSDDSAIRLNKDYYAGGLMILLGVAAMTQGADYGIGSLTAMEPGYFPVAVSALMVAMGVLIVAGARSKSAPGTSVRHKPEWRAWGCIVLANLAFIVLGRFGGLVPATFAVVFISALGDRKNSIKAAALLAAAMVVVSAVVFSWALQVQLPLFQWK